jgi:type II secretory pathway pseudopilin PulG
MGSPSHIRSRSLKGPRAGGFTLLEVMMVTFISSFVFAGVLSAYIFLGRSLARQANEESLESRGRLALYWVTQDVSAAFSITAQNPGTNASGTQFTLSVPIYNPSSGSSQVHTVTYACDWSQGPTLGILERQVDGGTPLVLLTNLTNFSFGYYDMTGTSVTAPNSPPLSPQIDIKQVFMTYTSSAGYPTSGAQSQYTVVSPRVVMKNKTLLTDPSDPHS